MIIETPLKIINSFEILQSYKIISNHLNKRHPIKCIKMSQRSKITSKPMGIHPCFFWMRPFLRRRSQMPQVTSPHYATWRSGWVGLAGLGRWDGVRLHRDARKKAVPSGKTMGKSWENGDLYGKSPFLMAKSTISMAMFNGKMLVHQRVPS